VNCREIASTCHKSKEQVPLYRSYHEGRMTVACAVTHMESGSFHYCKCYLFTYIRMMILTNHMNCTIKCVYHIDYNLFVFIVSFLYMVVVLGK
jgi:hypothetical protein